ncbi:MAG: sel1 repeat family protein [Kiritimatiellae bacterium]|nr:sel1 repeat family protein [Kiritimatiellia bacterium]
MPIYLIPFTDAFRNSYSTLAAQALPLIRAREGAARLSQEWVRASERLIEVEKQRATVFRQHTSRTIYADNNGMFVFHDLEPGTYMVFIEGTIKDRITIWSLLIDLVSGDSASLDFNDSNVGDTEAVYAFAGMSSVPNETPQATRPELSGNQLSDMAIAAANRGDHKTAIELLRAGADAGHALCQYNLGASYIDGIGVPQDYRQAVYWYQKAAQQGLATAQKKLGLCYYRGVGLAQDTRQAAYWFGQAAQQGDQEAIQVLNEIAYEDAKARGAQKSPPDQDAAEYFLTKAADTIVQMKIDRGELISARRRGFQFQHVRGNPQCDANAQVDYEFTFTTQAGLTRRNVGYLFFYHDPTRRDWFNSDTNIDGLPRYGR